MPIPPLIYHGKWTIPSYNSVFKKTFTKEYMGTLYFYEDRETILELYIKPPLSSESIETNINVIYGDDIYRQKFSLFHAKLLDSSNFNKYVFSIEYFIITDVFNHIKSDSDELFHICKIDYPYLREWAFKNIFTHTINTNSFSWDINKGLHIVVEIEDGINLIISSKEQHKTEDYKFWVEQTTEVTIVAKQPQSIDKFINLISKFSQFVSIATFSKHVPNIILLKRSIEQAPWINERLFFRTEETRKPAGYIINFNELENKIPTIIRKWYDNYEQLAPIAKYLIQSTTEQKEKFDAPDFLIIAQAIDGYFKRFSNKKDGKNTQKYKDQITKLLSNFKDIELLQKCNIDAEVMAHTRNKYSHLIPDNETKNIERAVSGEELYHLTRKGIVLLTCCILNCLGLTNEEINTSLYGSLISSIIKDISI